MNMQILRTTFCAVLFLCGAAAQDTRYPADADQIPGPANPADRAAWLADIRQWRAERKIRIGYSPREYERPETQWRQRNFVQPQVMVEDRYLYDPAAGRYTIDKYVDDLEKRYGGIDSVLLWSVYPNIGIDNRNQFDLLRDMPGGIAGLRQVVADFHRRNVRVFFTVMPWDTGSRDEGEAPWIASVKLMKAIGADGLNGDTFRGLPKAFLDASYEQNYPLVLEPEVQLSGDEQLQWNTQSWGYWKYPFVPSISKLKWIEPRHLVHVCRRWAREKTDDLQAAFFNGVGFESWENIWGIWNQMTPRDAETLRRISRIERRFAALLSSQDWEPHTATLQYGVFASKWPSSRETLWTIVNRTQYNIDGAQLRVPKRQGRRYFDVYHGVELKPREYGDSQELSFSMEAFGYGAVLALDGDPDAELNQFLAGMKALTARPLREYSALWTPLEQKLVESVPTKPASAVPPGMVTIPAVADFEFQVRGVMVEGSDDTGTGVQYPWESSPRRRHRHRMSIRAFHIDRYPVTNAEFKKFVDSARYQPRDAHNYLRDWKNGSYSEGWGNRPVTWVSLEDARAYAQWAGKRLPREWEWQYAAQGTDGRAYPWGNEWKDSAVPTVQSGRDMAPPAMVDAHPQGASPFGVMDLTGNVWQWTDEYVDEHTRSAILRGGSSYRPGGSLWYFPQARRLDEHGKYLLMAPSKDRSAMVGFRCVVDAP